MMKTYKIKAILTYKVYISDIYHFKNDSVDILANSKKDLYKKMKRFYNNNISDTVHNRLGSLNGIITSVRFERMIEVTTKKMKKFDHEFT